MPIHLFSAKRLAEKIAHGEVSSREYAYYLLAGFLIYMPIYYSGLASASPLWSWMSLYEVGVVILVTIVGIARSYDAAGGDENPNFVAEFTAFYVPVSVTTVPLVWTVYWAVSIGFQESIIALVNSNFQIAKNLISIGSNFFGLLLFVCVILTQVIIFYRITKLFHMVLTRKANPHAD
jgi:hypothetical protein